MVKVERGERKDGELPFVLFHSLRLGDEIFAADAENVYLFRVISGGMKPLAEFWWRKHPVNGQPQPWQLACADAALCGHCIDAKKLVYANELDEAVESLLPLDPTPEEFALGRRAWVAYPREHTGTYETFVSGPLTALDLRRPDAEAASAAS